MPVLTALTCLASLVAGVARSPWWFWLVAGATLTLLSITDPHRLRPRYAELGTMDALPMFLNDLRTGSAAFFISAMAFGSGSLLSWMLPV